MDIQKLSSKFQVRALTEADIDSILSLTAGNSLFFQHCPPDATRESILADMRALPPRTTYQDKFYLGFFDKNRLIAVLDLILHYPNPETAFIGFFMLDISAQAKGLGSKMVAEILGCLGYHGFLHTRLGYVKGNPQSRAFWLKNGFLDTGVESKTESYTIVALQRDNLENQIKTPHLRLHAFTSRDRKELSALLLNEAIKETYMIPDFSSTVALEKMIDQFFSLSLEDSHFVRGIYLEEQLIGFVNDVAIQDSTIELGYVIHPNHWCKGYATQMLRAVIDALHHRGYSTIQTGAFSENTASLRVMEKCGMRRLPVTEVIEYRGKSHTCIYYEA